MFKTRHITCYDVWCRANTLKVSAASIHFCHIAGFHLESMSSIWLLRCKFNLSRKSSENGQYFLYKLFLQIYMTTPEVTNLDQAPISKTAKYRLVSSPAGIGSIDLRHKPTEVSLVSLINHVVWTPLLTFNLTNPPPRMWKCAVIKSFQVMTLFFNQRLYLVSRNNAVLHSGRNFICHIFFFCVLDR